MVGDEPVADVGGSVFRFLARDAEQGEDDKGEMTLKLLFCFLSGDLFGRDVGAVKFFHGLDDCRANVLFNIHAVTVFWAQSYSKLLKTRERRTRTRVDFEKLWLSGKRT